MIADRASEVEHADEHLLRVLVERVRLAGDHHLERRAVREDPAHALGVVRQEEQALVGRDSPREAERQRVLGEGLGDRLDVLGILAAQQPVLHRLHPHVLDERATGVVAGAPQLLVRDAVDGRPGLGVGGAPEPALAEVAVEQRAHRRREERRQVDAVRDVGDRHVVGGRVGVEGAPHLARDLAVAQAHGVRASREAKRERRHPGRLVRAFVRPAEVEEPLGGDPEPRREVGERVRGTTTGRRSRSPQGQGCGS